MMHLNKLNPKNASKVYYAKRVTAQAELFAFLGF
jgi:hypothetical protein